MGCSSSGGPSRFRGPLASLAFRSSAPVRRANARDKPVSYPEVAENINRTQRFSKAWGRHVAEYCRDVAAFKFGVASTKIYCCLEVSEIGSQKLLQDESQSLYWEPCSLFASNSPPGPDLSSVVYIHGTICFSAVRYIECCKREKYFHA